MNGIINVMKSPGMTSFDVVSKIRKIFSIKKVGHAGTLDPQASGVLPVCIGTATKAIEFLMDKDKTYRVEMTLGVSTDTGDSTGKIIEEVDVDTNKEEIENALNSFIGKYEQVPPMYSAIKVNGVKLYELARKGIEIERKSREVYIYSIDLISINKNKVLFEVSCSKGTYVRTLCEDVGKKLGYPAHMSSLERLRAGIFDIYSAYTIEQIQHYKDNNEEEKVLLPVEKIFADFDCFKLKDYEEVKFLNGQFLPIRKLNLKSEKVRVYNSNDEFVAIGIIAKRENKEYLKIYKKF